MNAKNLEKIGQRKIYYNKKKKSYGISGFDLITGKYTEICSGKTTVELTNSIDVFFGLGYIPSL